MVSTADRRLNPGNVTRRVLLGGCAAMLAAAGPAAFPYSATLMVAGPAAGPVDWWADLLAPGLRQALPPGTSVRKDPVGGVDGVTGANQFDAQAVPDGSTALLLPGDAPLAWLVGDPRAKFDTAHWVPAFTASSPGVLLSRVSLSDAMGGTPVRVAAGQAGGEAASVLLALDMLGVAWQPVFGLTGAAAQRALAANQVQAVLVTGRQVSEQVQALAPSGTLPVLAFDGPSGSGEPQRDPAFPDTPCLGETLAGRQVNPALLRAWYALATATTLDVAMVLPQLTPAALVAIWRRAVGQALAGAAVQASTQALGIRPSLAPNAAMAALSVDLQAQLALRGWLAERMHYRPT